MGSPKDDLLHRPYLIKKMTRWGRGGGFINANLVAGYCTCAQYKDIPFILPQRPSINYVVSIGGVGNPKDDSLHRPYSIKNMTKGGGGQKLPIFETT